MEEREARKLIIIALQEYCKDKDFWVPCDFWQEKGSELEKAGVSENMFTKDLKQIVKEACLIKSICPYC